MTKYKSSCLHRRTLLAGSAVLGASAVIAYDASKIAWGRSVDLEEVWRIREEDVYPRLFGPLRRGIFTLTHELFSRRFGPQQIDPRWLTMGVMEFAPTAARKSWLYVTSGYSNPWD